MTQFHAVLIDETGCEFGATINAANYDEAYDQLREDYPESSVVQLESPADTAARQKAIYDSVSAEYDDDYYDDDDF